MTAGAKLNERYEKLEVLGEGGMGIVYRAWDANLRREVALKTLRDIQDRNALEMFRKEIAILAGITHPNIVDVYEVGEIQEKEGKRPYFVMPLLRGVTLDKLISTSGRRLTVERCIDVISQVCRGLQAAHDAGLVHRDLKPSNLFILDDDSVKIIDFGIAHLVDAHSTAGLKGTLLYMSPEQLLLKKPTPLSDLFSVAVVCFTAITGRHPFEGLGRDEIADAIVRRTPPPASEFNPAVNLALSQVIHKAMAKQPFQRFASARDFADNLQKAYRNEPLEWFDPLRVDARVQRARRAFERGELGMAADILSELEAEASLHPDLASLRKQVDSAVRQRTVSQLLDTARHCLENMEYQLALQKVEEALSFDRTNKDASALKGEIEEKKSVQQVEDWLRLACQHLENHSYAHARQAVQNVLNLKPKDARAQQLVTEVDRREQEYVRLRQEKEQVYRAAIEAFERGELSSALTKLERVLDMDRRAPDTMSVDRGAQYQKLYNEVRSEHDALTSTYAEARRYLETGNFGGALTICEEVLSKYPDNAPFQMLKLDAEDRQRQERSAYVARIGRELEAEPDLNRKIRALEEGLAKYPDESFFQRSVQSIGAKRDLVESIIAKARTCENTGQYTEALSQWEIVRQIYSPYPGLDFEIDRVRKRRDQKERLDAKRRWIEQIDRTLAAAEFSRALELCSAALADFPGDPELMTAAKTAEQGLERTTVAQKLVEMAEDLVREGKSMEAIDLLWEAQRLDTASTRARNALVDLLLNQAGQEIDSDWRAAEQHIEQALEVDPGNGRAKSFRTLIQDRKEQDYVTEVLSQARMLRGNGDLTDALAVLDEAIKTYPRNADLQQQRTAVLRSIEEQQARENRRRDLEQARALERNAQTIADADALRSIFEQTKLLATRYVNDADFDTVLRDIGQRLDRISPEGTPHVSIPEPDEENRARQHDAGKRLQPARSLRKELIPSVLERLRTWRGVAAAYPIRFWLLITRGLHATGRMAAATTVRVAPALRAGAGQAAAAAASARKRVLRLPRWQQITALGLAFTAAVVLFWTVASIFIPPDAGSEPFEFGRLIMKVEPATAEVVVQDADNRVVTNEMDRLPTGEYTVRASAPGFDPVERRVSVTATGPTPVLITLPPAAPMFEVYTTIEGIEAVLDNQPLQAPGFTAAGLSDGDHTLALTTKGGGKLNLAFRSRRGSIPEIVSLSANRIRAVGIATHGQTLSAVRPSGGERVSLSVNKSSPEDIVDGGLKKDGIAAGNHTMALIYGTDRVELPLDVAAQPKLTLFLTVNDNFGYLLVETGQPDVQLEVDGTRRRARRGSDNRLTLALEPKEYSLRILKDGFYPEEQKIKIQKGLQTRLQLALREIPTVGTLVVRNARGAEVQVDNGNWRPAGADGTLTVQASPGRHTIRVRKPGFRPAEQGRELPAGGEVVLDVSQLVFDPLLWRVTFQTVPAEASLRLSGPDGKEVPLSGRAADLRDGKYLVTASAPGYETAQRTFDVAGKEQSIELPLSRRVVPVPAQPSAAVGGMEGWSSAGDWQQNSDWYVRQRSDLTFYRSSTGKFQFTVPCGTFSCGVRLFAAYIGPEQQVRIDYERNKVKWRIQRGGKTEQGDAAHRSSGDGTLHVALSVSPGLITISDPKNGYKEIATIPVSAFDWSKARFGTTAKKMAHFKYTPR